MSQASPSLTLDDRAEDVRWHFLYRAGAISALATVVLFVFQLAAYFVWPPPSTVAGHYALLQSHWFIGIISLDFLILVDELLAIPLSLALYLSLRRVHESLMLLATALAGVSIMCFLVATPALNMLSLSRQFAVASSDAQREALLAVGNSLMWSSAFQVGYVVGSIEMLIVAWVMLYSPSFGKAAAYVGIAASLIGLGIYVPKVGVQLSLLSVVGMQVWYIMIAQTLWRVSRKAAR